MQPSPAAPAFWRRRVRQLKRRVDTATWIAAWTPGFLAVSLASSIAVLAARRLGASTRWAFALAAMAHLGAALVALLVARRRRFTLQEAVVRLDIAFGLRSRLISAYAGVPSWPAPRADSTLPLRWNWPRVLGPFAAGILLAAVAATIPVTASAPAAPSQPAPPAAWREVESWLAGLEERRLVESQSLESWQARMEELRRQPAHKWYSHSSLEAGDSLRQELEGALKALGRDMERAGDALESAGTFPDAARDEDLRALAREFDGALSELERGPLALDKRLLSELKAQAPLRALSPEQLAGMRELRARLREGAGFCRIAVRDCRPDEEDCLVTGARRGIPGVSRGPGTLPLTLDPERTELGTQRVEGVANEDVRKAAPGDLLGVGRSRHRIDAGAFRAPSEGGKASLGSGGESVWRSPTTPEERRILERYFK
jgi:hypothetical protein